MELQWPLILFTTLVAWSAGLFGAQAVAVLRGGGGRAQMPALVASVALLAAGGIAVFFHLQHWERIFNGFGHLTSGITQETHRYRGAGHSGRRLPRAAAQVR